MNKTFELNAGDKITYRPSGPGRDKTAYVILVEEFFVLVSTADPVTRTVCVTASPSPPSPRL